MRGLDKKSLLVGAALGFFALPFLLAKFKK